MSDREKLIELLGGYKKGDYIEARFDSVIESLISNGVTVQKWIPVSERLPQEDELKATHCDTVQVLLKSGEVTVGWCNRYVELWYHLPHNETRFVGADYENTPVVAWKPLAEPPKECE